MIVFGAGTKLTLSAPIPDTLCANCQGSPVVIHIIQQFFHLFGIPTFPVQKIPVMECPHCGLSKTGKAIPKELAPAVKVVKGAAKIPRRYFAGLYVIAGIALLAVLNAWVQRNLTEARFKEPHINDMYVFHMEKIDPTHQYMVMRVMDVGADSIAMALGSYGYLGEHDAADAIDDGIVNQSGYFDDSVKIARSDLQGFYDHDQIRRILRP